MQRIDHGLRGGEVRFAYAQADNVAARGLQGISLFEEFNSMKRKNMFGTTGEAGHTANLG